MAQRLAPNYKPKPHQLLALIERVKMPQQLMVPHHHIQQHPDAKHIYLHAIGMVIQDVRVEDAQLILVYSQLAQQSPLLEYLVGQHQQVGLMLLA